MPQSGPSALQGVKRGTPGVNMRSFALQCVYKREMRVIELCWSWWRHQMETFSALLAIYAGNSPVYGDFPAKRPVTRNFDVFFDLRPNERLSKHSWGWWLETPSRPLWSHCNAKLQFVMISNGPVDKRCISLNVNESLLKTESHVKVIGVTLDDRLPFNEDVSVCCSKSRGTVKCSRYLDTSPC